MCGRYELNATAAELEAHFAGVVATPRWKSFDLLESYNIAPSLQCPVIRHSKHSQENVIERLVWGFRPQWAKRSWINARDDRLFTTRAFSRAAKQRRCLVIATGWYEWQARASEAKQPYYAHLRDRHVLAFAGVWTARKLDIENWELSFAIVTTAASTALSRIHDRMPLIVKPRNYAAWLDPVTPAPESLLAPDEGPFDFHPVSVFVNDPKHDGPRCSAATC